MADWSWNEGFDMARARRAEENKRTDEFGISKPPKAWTSRITDYFMPDEAVQASDASDHWYSEIPRTLGAGLLGTLGGHVMDSISPIDTRGDWQVPVPILGELAHGEAEVRYEREHEAAVEAAEARAHEVAVAQNPTAPTQANADAADCEALEAIPTAPTQDNADGVSSDGPVWGP